MKVLISLWLMKQKAVIRNLFRRWTTALFTIIMVVIYGGLFVMMLKSSEKAEISFNMQSVHLSILLGLGFSAVMIFTQLLQKRKALFYEQDSFYLFCGPFTRTQIMGYLMLQSILGASTFSLFVLFIMVSFSFGMPMNLPFLLLCFLCFTLLYLFWINATDFLYIMAITNERYKRLNHLAAAGMIVVIIVVFLLSLAINHFEIKTGLMSFAESSLFYLIPVFGWVKLILISFVMQNWLSMILGIALLLLSYVLLAAAFLNFKGDFYEQAMMDSAALTHYMENIKSGKQNSFMQEVKVKKTYVKFMEGAGAIYSKNILLMKKTRSFLRLQDILVVMIYFLVSFFLPHGGFPVFCYMLVFWLFAMIQDSDMMHELKNYQIYLIPDAPLKKLLYVMLPTLEKVMLLTLLAVGIAGMVYEKPLLLIVQYIVMLWGYLLVFLSSSVASVRIFKSRNNAMLENMMRMLIMLLSAVPSIAFAVIYVLSSSNFSFDDTAVSIMTYSSLSMNVVISFLIIFSCKNMMNGRELDSE
ncbi:MAG: hypothetical protein HFG16_03950 [Erysipelotrichaceae bacterium]|jgi:hypothetical protein|nr:hypothetical protein [Erysipelotrichaceae bacterium]